MTLVMCIPYKEYQVQNNVTLVVVGLMNLQGVQESLILHRIYTYDVKYAKYAVTIHILHIRVL